MTHEPSQSDPFACDESHGASAADDLVIHGLLSLLGPDESATIQRRIDRAMCAIRAGRPRSRVTMVRRLVVAGGSFALAAVILFALFFAPSDTDSQAYATLDSIRSTPRQGTRVYRIRAETELPPSSADPRGRLPSQGTLVLGPEGRWTLSFAIPPQKPHDSEGATARQPRGQVTFGFDGSQYWMVGPGGVARRAGSLRELRPPLMVGALDAGVVLIENETDDLEPLTLDLMLSRLDRGFKTTFQQPLGDGTLQGRPLSIVTFDRQGPGAQRGGPKSVRVVADAQTNEVLKAQWTWVDGGAAVDGGKPAIARRVNIELVSAEDGSLAAKAVSAGLAWFDSEFHSGLSKPNHGRQPR